MNFFRQVSDIQPRHDVIVVNDYNASQSRAFLKALMLGGNLLYSEGVSESRQRLPGDIGFAGGSRGHALCHGHACQFESVAE